jgi:hypothetical protein
MAFEGIDTDQAAQATDTNSQVYNLRECTSYTCWIQVWDGAGHIHAITLKGTVSPVQICLKIG